MSRPNTGSTTLESGENGHPVDPQQERFPGACDRSGEPQRQQDRDPGDHPATDRHQVRQLLAGGERRRRARPPSGPWDRRTDQTGRRHRASARSSPPGAAPGRSDRRTPAAGRVAPGRTGGSADPPGRDCPAGPGAPGRGRRRTGRPATPIRVQNTASKPTLWYQMASVQRSMNAPAMSSTTTMTMPIVSSPPRRR